jgi:membrane-bound metal-dependent hydrolase YbcI (DUF457 family)
MEGKFFFCPRLFLGTHCAQARARSFPCSALDDVKRLAEDGKPLRRQFLRLTSLSKEPGSEKIFYYREDVLNLKDSKNLPKVLPTSTEIRRMEEVERASSWYFTPEGLLRMQGPSHVGFALAGAVTLNSLTNFFIPRPVPGLADDIIHAIGTPYGYPQLTHLCQMHQVTQQLGPDLLIHKLTFFLVLGWASRLPDRLEERKEFDPESGRVRTVRRGHRGCTHSCLFLSMLIVLFVMGFSFGMSYLQQHHLILSTFMLKELFAAFLGLIGGILLHVLADSMTTKGVQVMWPESGQYHSMPEVARFNNGAWQEYAILWGFIFLVGVLVGLGVFGF